MIRISFQNGQMCFEFIHRLYFYFYMHFSYDFFIFNVQYIAKTYIYIQVNNTLVYLFSIICVT